MLEAHAMSWEQCLSTVVEVWAYVQTTAKSADTPVYLAARRSCLQSPKRQ
jgi:hypothetical protein